jgi:hypothetical protein
MWQWSAPERGLKPRDYMSAATLIATMMLKAIRPRVVMTRGPFFQRFEKRYC